MYLELQDFLQIPYNRYIFMHRLSKGRQKRNKKNAFATMKLLKMNYYFKVFTIILMHYIIINFLLKEIESACPRIENLLSLESLNNDIRPMDSFYL